MNAWGVVPITPLPTSWFHFVWLGIPVFLTVLHCSGSCQNLGSWTSSLAGQSCWSFMCGTTCTWVIVPGPTFGRVILEYPYCILLLVCVAIAPTISH